MTIIDAGFLALSARRIITMNFASEANEKLQTPEVSVQRHGCRARHPPKKMQRTFKKPASAYDFLQIRVQYPKPEPDEYYLMTISYRRLTPTDAIAYRLLMLKAYTLHPDAFTSDVKEREALPIAWWEKRLDSSLTASEVVFAAIEDDQLLGVAGLSVEPRKKARHKSTVFGMYVPLAHSNKGIGGQLMSRVLAHAKSLNGLLIVQLTVTEGNAGAQALYERMGFVTFGLEPLAVSVGSGFVSKVHMWKDLRE